MKDVSRIHARMLIGALCTFAWSSAHADFIGLYVGGGYWSSDLGGDVIADVSVDNQLDLTGDSGNHLYVAFEHPIPLIPNIKLARTSVDDSGTGVLSTSFDFNGTTYTAGQTVSTSLDLTHTDLTLYYEIVDVAMDFDLGITARNFEGELRVDAESESLDVTLPMVYAYAKFGLPFTGTYFSGQANAISYSGSSVTDYSVALGWETENFILPEVGIEGGYRRFSVEGDDDFDVDVSVDVDGFFLNLTGHF